MNYIQNQDRWLDLMNATEAEGSAAQALHRQASLAATQGLITQEEKAHIQEQLEVAAAEEGGGGGGGEEEEEEEEEEEDGASRSSSSISSISNMSNTSNRSNSSSNGSNFGVPPKLPVSLRKRRAHSTGPIASYEVRRMTKHRTVFGQQGRLRRFWRRVQRHQSGQLLVVERIAKFVRDRATVQHHFAVALDKLAAASAVRARTSRGWRRATRRGRRRRRRRRFPACRGTFRRSRSSRAPPRAWRA